MVCVFGERGNDGMMCFFVLMKRGGGVVSTGRYGMMDASQILAGHHTGMNRTLHQTKDSNDQHQQR